MYIVCVFSHASASALHRIMPFPTDMSDGQVEFNMDTCVRLSQTSVYRSCDRIDPYVGVLDGCWEQPSLPFACYSRAHGRGNSLDLRREFGYIAVQLFSLATDPAVVWDVGFME
jgi:hypothetical protein